MKPALLVIDVQRSFFDISPKTAQSLSAAIEYINQAIALFRGKGLPVVAIQHMDDEQKLLPGEPGFDLPESLNILPSDLHIHKRYGNAFNQTSLAQALQEQDVDTVLLSGFCAEYCVLSTCRGAEDLDLKPILLRDALASVVPENIRFVESINEIISYGALRTMLG